jgi:hypothetical protein
MHYINDIGNLVAGRTASLLALVAGRTASLLALVACGQLVYIYIYMHGGNPFISKSKPATSAKLGYFPVLVQV